MLTIYDSSHIKTNRCLPGHRACRTNTGFFLGAGEARRAGHEIIDLINRRLRRQWLKEARESHLSRCPQR